jgi:hypothetical protein
MAASSFNIDAFTSKLTHGGALASLFECELTGNTGGDKGSTDTWTFMCKGATFPASAIDVATVTYMGSRKCCTFTHKSPSVCTSFIATCITS